MIYNSMVTSVNESEFDELLENAEDRFEDMTIAEAGSILVAEQEQNWTKFMQGVGLSELNSVMEGQEVIYEGGRLESFIEKAKAYFKMAINKLAQITKSFIAKVMQLVSTNNAFLKKYETDLKKLKTVDYKGYNFNSKLNDEQKYKDSESTVSFEEKVGASEAARKAFTDIKYDDDKSFGEQVKDFLYGEDGKNERTYNVSDQIKILKDTKDLKQKASKNYKKSAGEIKKIIKKLERDQKDNLKDSSKKDYDVATGNATHNDLQRKIECWRAYSNCLLTYHSKLMSALGARNRQAKAICTKALTKNYKAEGRKERNKLRKGAGMSEKVYSEGAINTDAFLGAVDFI